MLRAAYVLAAMWMDGCTLDFAASVPSKSGSTFFKVTVTLKSSQL